jgi:hypothetical protein
MSITTIDRALAADWPALNGDPAEWSAETREACHQAAALRTAALRRPGIRDLVGQLEFRTYRPAYGPLAPHLTTCWLTREDARRYALIVPAFYNCLDYLRLVTVSVVEQAAGAGIVEIGEPRPMPPYNYGGRYHWRTIQQGQPLRLAQHAGGTL